MSESSVAGVRFCVAALITDADGRVLLVRNRKRNEAAGGSVWELPGGKLKFGETWQTGAAREVLEETGIVVSIEAEPHAILEGSPAPGAEFRSRIIVTRGTGDGNPRAGDDAIGAGWFARDVLPALAPLATAELVRAWAADCETREHAVAARKRGHRLMIGIMHEMFRAESGPIIPEIAYALDRAIGAEQRKVPCADMLDGTAAALGDIADELSRLASRRKRGS